MSKITKSIALLLAMLLFSLAFTGCTDSAPVASTSCALILGVRKNFPLPSVSCESLSAVIEEAVLDFGTITTVTSDGVPTLLEPVSVSDEGLSDYRMSVIAQQVAQGVLDTAYAGVPQAAETDLLAALTLAGRSLVNRTQDRRLIVVVDNGLSTAGVLNFAKQPLLKTSPEEIVAQLNNMGAIPDLSGCELIWIGMGETEAPQSALSPTDRQALKAIWSAILTETNASFVISDEVYATAAVDKSTFPYVSVVSSEHGTVEPEPKPEPAPELPVVSVLTEVRRFDSTSVAFKSSSVELIDPAAAQDALQEVVDILGETPIPIVVAGATATADTVEKCRSFSLRRAETIRALLVEMGVDTSLITTVGLGYDLDPYHTHDLDANGRLIEVEAQKNRCVYIVAAESDAGRQLMDR